MKVFGLMRAFRILGALRKEAQHYREDDARSGALALSAEAKAKKHRGVLARVWTDLTDLTRLLRAWATRRYRDVPWRKVSLVIAGLLYFVSPLDAIPDFLPGLGLLDDVFIVTWLVKTLREELEKFRAWESPVV
jgi:uncharacterized membrane protein YkvA (DUF1232 family)